MHQLIKKSQAKKRLERIYPIKSKRYISEYLLRGLNVNEWTSVSSSKINYVEGRHTFFRKNKASEWLTYIISQHKFKCGQ